MKYLTKLITFLFISQTALFAAFSTLGSEKSRNILDDMDALYGAGNWERIDDFDESVNDQKWTTRLEGDIVIKGKFAGLVHEFGYRDGSVGGEFISLLPEIKENRGLYTKKQQREIGTAFIANDSLNFRFVLKLNDINWKGNTSGYGPRWEWSSNPAQNKGGQDHVVTFRIIDNKGAQFRENNIGLFVIAWEDLDYDGAFWGKSDKDFGDLIIELPGAKPANFVETNESPLTLANLIACNTTVSNYTEVIISDTRVKYTGGADQLTQSESIEIDFFTVHYDVEPDSIEVLSQVMSQTDRTVLRFVGDKELDSLGFHIELIEKGATEATIAVVAFTNSNSLTNIEFDLFTSGILASPTSLVSIPRNISCRDGETPNSSAELVSSVIGTTSSATIIDISSAIATTSSAVEIASSTTVTTTSSDGLTHTSSANGTITLSGSTLSGSSSTTENGTIDLTGETLTGSSSASESGSIDLTGNTLEGSSSNESGSVTLDGIPTNGTPGNSNNGSVSLKGSNTNGSEGGASDIATDKTDEWLLTLLGSLAENPSNNNTNGSNGSSNISLNGSTVSGDHKNTTSKETYQYNDLNQGSFNTAIASIPDNTDNNSNNGSFNINGYTIDDSYTVQRKDGAMPGTKNLTETFGDDYIQSYVAQQDLGLNLDSSEAYIKNASIVTSETGSDTLILSYNTDVSDKRGAVKKVFVNGETVLFTIAENTNKNSVKLILSEGTVITDGEYYIEIQDSLAQSVFNDQFATLQTIHTLPKVSNHGNGFYDLNVDGSMDHIKITFKAMVTPALLEGATFTFSWLNAMGIAEEFNAPISNAHIDESNSAVIYWNIEEFFAPAPFTTHINKSTFGSATLHYAYTADGITKTRTESIVMKDCMAPVIMDVKLDIKLESSERDTLMVTFSEDINTGRVNRDDLFVYKSNEGTMAITAESQKWLSTRTIQLIVAQGDVLLIGDSVRVTNDLIAFDGYLIDLTGNSPHLNPYYSVIEGNPRAMVEKIVLNSYDPNAPSHSDAPITEEVYVDVYTTAADLKEEGKIGHLIEIGPNTFPQALEDQANGVFNPEEYSFDYRIFYYTQSGAYVADTKGTVTCSDAGFSGNCLENPNKLFIQWNYKADSHQNIATGTYIVTMQLMVSTPAERFVQQNSDTWGVIRN
ncbi:MAG: hypothetical protein OCD76_16975 [Reichenbachiella sp.]